MSLDHTWSEQADLHHNQITAQIHSARLDQEVRQLLRSLGDGNISAFWPLWNLYRVHLLSPLFVADARRARRCGGRSEPVHVEGAREAAAYE